MRTILYIIGTITVLSYLACVFVDATWSVAQMSYDVRRTATIVWACVVAFSTMVYVLVKLESQNPS